MLIRRFTVPRQLLVAIFVSLKVEIKGVKVTCLVRGLKLITTFETMEEKLHILILSAIDGSE
jgi:hypothetical protein